MKIGSKSLKDDILLEYRKNRTERTIITLVILSTGFFFNAWIMISLFALVILLILIFTKNDSFNGYELDEYRLILFYDTFLLQDSQELYLNEIDTIKYFFYSSGGDSYISYSVDNEEYISNTFNSIYSFAKVLKYLKMEEGINVFCKGEIDVEIELYLNDKIDELPMKNK